jgi:hypothetical protein
LGLSIASDSQLQGGGTRSQWHGKLGYLKCCSYNQKIELAADNEEELVSSEDDAVPYCKKQKVVADKSSRLRNSSKVSFGVPYSDSTGHLSHLFEGGLSSSEEEEEEEDKDAPTESEVIKQDRADAILEFDKVIKKWPKKTVEWRKLFPNEVKTDTPDLVKDLMPLKMGVVYNDIIKSDMERKRYGYLPLMASCSKGQIGALNAESYAERVNDSMGKLVITDGNSLLKDDETEMLVVLRMNRDFMCFMREHYGEHILKM